MYTSRPFALMSKQKITGLFVFRRDLRVEDNHGLHAACADCDKVFCIFVLDPRQIETKNNEYFSANAFAFMLESLQELQKTIGLTILRGDPAKEILAFAKEKDVATVYWNLDYTPFALERDKKITAVLEANSISIKSFDDIPLNAPTVLKPMTGTVGQSEGLKPYKVFTPYYRAAIKIKIAEEVQPNLKKISAKDSASVKLSDLLEKIAKHKNSSPERQRGGRTAGLERLDLAAKNASKYLAVRDDLTQETSRLSPYLKFGVIGKREAYRAVKNVDFRRELYWGDFYLQVSYHFPHVLRDEKQAPEKSGTYNIGKNFKQQKLKWDFDPKLWEAFQEGKLGVPLVDAAIHQLKATGYMHNRCRMVVANVLTKFLHIDWRHGEKFFAIWLTDYDPSNNNGGWQWAAGTGADAQPYYRIFNPYTQAKKSDPECIYIKKWLPTLKSKTPAEIFKMVSPLFNYEKERAEAIARFRNANE